MKKVIAIILVILLMMSFTACAEVTGTASDVVAQQEIGGRLASNQKTPTDINYSLERYNLIRRAYWVNGQREKANTLICEIEKPLGYIVLFAGNAVVGRFVVDGKVSSLNSFLTPDSEYYDMGKGDVGYRNEWLPDVDGSYGENDDGIFFFTPDGNYLEWTEAYLYSDIPFEIRDPVVSYEVVE